MHGLAGKSTTGIYRNLLCRYLVSPEVNGKYAVFLRAVFYKRFDLSEREFSIGFRAQVLRRYPRRHVDDLKSGRRYINNGEVGVDS
jgi:hypothetical protein